MIDTDTDFVCFEFAFSMGTALAAVGGLWTAMQVITKCISRSLILSFTKCKTRCCFKYPYCVQVVIFLMAFVICLLAWIGYLYYILFVSNGGHFRIASLVRFLFIIFTILFGLAIPWHNFVVDKQPEQPEKKKLVPITSDLPSTYDSVQKKDTNA